MKECKSFFRCGQYDDVYGINIYLKDEKEEKEIFSDYCGEPEDNSYGRDHTDVLDVPTLLQKFYQMGRNGEVILFSEEDIPNDDYDF